MTEAKHTPGPWLVVGCTVYALHGEQPRNRFTALVQSGRRDDASWEEQIATAHLMAAAPELLAALDELLTDVGRASSMRGAVKARAAIAKATA